MTTRTLTNAIEVQFQTELKKSGLRLSNSAARELSEMLRIAARRVSERGIAEAELGTKMNQLLIAIGRSVKERTHDAKTLRARRYAGGRPLVMPSDVHAALKYFCPCWPIC